MSVSFQKATKQQLAARVALAAPTGAGKTWTSLGIASVFGDRTVLIDSEKGSGALYADEFDYDYYRFDAPYAPSRLTEIIKDADAQGYDTIIIDSLSHFWEGEGGTLDIVDAAAQRSNGNSYAGWKVGTPELRHLVDAMLDLRAHLIVTMRSKMEYILQEKTNRAGRTVMEPTKVGMAPVMRAGVEYEFTIVGDMDLEHRITISKSRCSALADQVVQPHREKEMAETFIKWLRSGEATVTAEQVEKIRACLDGIDPDSERSEIRNSSKRNWKDAFGDPQRLSASQFAKALTYAEVLAASALAELSGEGEPVGTKRLVSKPESVDAQGDALANLEFVLQGLDERIQGKVRAEIKKTFGAAAQMGSDEIRTALKMAEDWPKPAEGPTLMEQMDAATSGAKS